MEKTLLNVTIVIMYTSTKLCENASVFFKTNFRSLCQGKLVIISSTLILKMRFPIFIVSPYFRVLFSSNIILIKFLVLGRLLLRLLFHRLFQERSSYLQALNKSNNSWTATSMNNNIRLPATHFSINDQAIFLIVQLRNWVIN